MGLPAGLRWPDWRNALDDDIRELLDRPKQGVLFDIENSDFWFSKWGERPKQIVDRLSCARELMATVPILVPIYAHRYCPAEPAPAGSPVLSVWQTDVIVYGAELDDYVRSETLGNNYTRTVMPGEPRPQPTVHITFWMDLDD